VLRIILKAHESHRESVIESFCLSVGQDLTWIGPDVATFSLEHAASIQLRVLYDTVREDLGFRITMVIGFDHDLVLREALAVALDWVPGQITELGDLLILAHHHNDQRLALALDRVLSTVEKDVLETARMQLLTGSNGVLASQLLYIHRNTFRYRLNKFIEQTGIDLRESTLAYALKVYGTLSQQSSE
jgi:hypothetical protein